MSKQDLLELAYQWQLTHLFDARYREGQKFLQPFEEPAEEYEGCPILYPERSFSKTEVDTLSIP